MKNLSYVASNLFNKIRGRFSDVTIGDEEGTVTNIPEEARYFDFGYIVDGIDLGKVSVNISEDTGLTVIMSQDFASEQTEDIQKNWYSFLKELRLFAKKNMMNFDVRDINKNNLTKRDYSFLATKPSGDETMAESKMYGTNKTSYQRIGNARLAIKHVAPINVESATGRTQKINAIYIESPTGERFKYPYKHLSGARAMAVHVSEGGNAYDDFGKYISGLSEEISKLRRFSQYINRSSVVAEGLADYTGIVKERVATIKKEIQNLQKPSYYAEAVSSYTAPDVQEVPEDVAENWIDQLTIKQFNEELKDVFPYIYKLVSEATKATELGPDDIIDESGLQYYTGVKKHGKEYMKKAAQAGREGASQEELGRLKDKYSKAEKKKTKEEFELEQTFEDAMGQFADHVCEDCGNPSWRTLSEEKQKGVDGKVCWKGYKRMGTKMKGGKRVDNCVKVKEEDEIEEAYINSSKDAIEILSNLRKIGKSIELGQGSYDGNLAGMYVNDVYDVVTWLESNADTSDVKFKQIVAPVIELRKKAKSMEREPGSGKDAGFANEIVNTLYPLMQWIEMNVQEGNAFAHAVRQAKMSGKKKGDKITGPDGKEVTLEKQQTPLGEFILSYFDRENGTFPKGPTAVLTMVEKDYGTQYVKPAAKFIQKVEATVAKRNAQETLNSRYPQTEIIKQLAGL